MIDLERAVQINDGLRETSGDAPNLAFDSKYGIMFCAYMPGKHGSYGESRGRISLSYFPASQPTNIRFIDIVEGDDVYQPNILGLGDGKVRVFYEKYSREDRDHPWCYKDFDYINNKVSEENCVMIKKPDGEVVQYGHSVVFEYFEENGYNNHTYLCTEQLGFCTPFRHDDGYVYGAFPSVMSEVALFRSNDDMATVEFFAICPYQAQYEFEYRFLDGKLHAIYRTEKELNSIYYTWSSDMGKTWSEPIVIEQSVSCRPRMVLSNGQIIIAYNHYNNDSGNRPTVIQGRTSIRLCLLKNENPNKNRVLAELHSKYGIVNISVVDILGDLYLAYSTSELALEYQNGTPWVRGKDGVRYLKLGDIVHGVE